MPETLGVAYRLSLIATLQLLGWEGFTSTLGGNPVLSESVVTMHKGHRMHRMVMGWNETLRGLVVPKIQLVDSKSKLRWAASVEAGMHGIRTDHLHILAQPILEEIGCTLLQQPSA